MYLYREGVEEYNWSFVLLHPKPNVGKLFVLDTVTVVGEYVKI